MTSQAPVLLLSALLAACQIGPPVPAVLQRADDATMTRLKATLAQAMGRSQVELGPGDPTQSSIISVLPLPPGPLEDRSLARPTTFRLETVNGDCHVVREDTHQLFRLEGVACRKAR
jgi:hypothetical protein